jgi:hypothetical protein
LGGRDQEGRIKVRSQLGQIVPKTPSPKNKWQNTLEMWLKQQSICFASLKP